MHHHLQSTLLRYLAALLFAAAAVGLRALLDPLLGGFAPVVMVLGAVALTVWYVGPGPAIACAIFGVLAALYLFVPPAGSLKLGASGTVLAVVHLVGCGVVITLGELARRRDLAARVARRVALGNEHVLQLIVDALPMLVAYVDTDLHYRFTNATYQAWFGRRGERLPGQHVRELLGETAFRNQLPRIRAVLDGETVKFEERLEHALGGPREVAVTYVPHRRGDAVVGYFALVEDVGDRRRAESAGAQLEAIVEATDDALLSIGPDGLVQSWNRGAEQLFGWRAGDMLGQSSDRLLPPGREDEERLLRERALGGERPGGLHTERRHRDGRLLPVWLTAAPIRSSTGEVAGVLLILRRLS